MCSEMYTDKKRSNGEVLPLGSRGWDLDPHINVAIAYFARKSFCAFPLAAARSIFQPDVPAMPAADHFAGLYDAFA